jgi:peptide/nickel transport system permease protein
VSVTSIAGVGGGTGRRLAAQGVVRRFASNRVAVVAALVVLTVVVIAVLAPWIVPHDPNEQHIVDRFKRPGDGGLLGTDDYGRDVFSRLMIGARVSLMAAGEATLIAVVLGAPLGMLAGFHAGRLDAVLSRVSDVVMSVPFLILALTVMSVIGYGLGKAMAVVGVVLAPGFFRVARGVTQDVRGEAFIEASISIGCTTARTLGAHVLPNALAPLLVKTVVTIGVGVSAEASLSFLGLGAAPPTASWGGMLRSALSDYRSAPYLAWVPGVMITVTVLALTIFGDGLRDAVGTHRIARKVRG